MTRTRQDIQDDRQANQDVVLAIVKNDVGYIKDEVRVLSSKLDSGYVQKGEFKSLKDKVDLIFKGFFFLVGIMAVAIFGAIFRVIFR